MPKCAQILIGALVLILHQTIGTAATVAFAFAVIHWALTTPAVLVAIASLAAYHLLNYHSPRTRRPRAVRAH